jgi:glycosyltransferase involved in cell wall biosynthesis
VRENIDALFSTANFAMFRCPVRQLLLVRNALYFSKLYQQMFLLKHSLGMRIAFRLRRWLICQSVCHSDVVMTPTQAMLDDLRRFVKVDAARTLVNPYGVTPPCSSSSPNNKPDTRLQPPSPYRVGLVYVSLYSEHKNLSTLLKALPLLNKNGSRKFLLKTTVDPAWAGAAWTVTHKWDLGLARQPDVAPWVEFFGPLRAELVQDIYRGGDVFVFPSFCESFGHPMVEAMAHGLPIVAADTPVNREICGEAALYFSALDPKDLAEKVALLGRERALREKLGTTGRLRASAHFRWENHVARLLQAVS